MVTKGVEATIELQEAKADKGTMYAGLCSNRVKFSHESNPNVAAARRRGLADNKLEDALYVGGTRGSIVAGGAVDFIVPSELELQDVVERTKLKADFLKASDKFGSLQDAGEGGGFV